MEMFYQSLLCSGKHKLWLSVDCINTQSVEIQIMAQYNK